jgi:hypothetical protein
MPIVAQKKIDQNSLIGQKGVNLIEAIVLDIGFLWHPSVGPEAGIDGIIEIRDSITGEVSNSIIQVQSKATTQQFQDETADGFDYVCKDKDLQYWLQGNAPVILIRSRPDTNEAYWVSIKDYFSDPEKRRDRRIHFNKQRDRFDRNSRSALISLAVPKDAGIYFAPTPKNEVLYSNLLRVSRLPERIYTAHTNHKDRRDMWSAIENIGATVTGEWTVRSEHIYSLRPLDSQPWDILCDVGTLEEFDAQEWAFSDDPERHRIFVELLNYCLREKARGLALRYSRMRECYYFEATEDLRPRTVTYQSVTNRTTRTVFRGYPKPENPKYYRHSAFANRFQICDGNWFLEITPTYYFTWDGYKPDRFYEERLKGIKRLESNAAVLGQLIMWAEYLSRKDFITKSYSLLEFDSLATFNIDSGIEDKAWLPNEEANAKEVLSATEPLLF